MARRLIIKLNYILVISVSLFLLTQCGLPDKQSGEKTYFENLKKRPERILSNFNFNGKNKGCKR